MDFTLQALESTLPVDTMQQNTVLKRMVSMLRRQESYLQHKVEALEAKQYDPSVDGDRIRELQKLLLQQSELCSDAQFRGEAVQRHYQQALNACRGYEEQTHQLVNKIGEVTAENKCLKLQLQQLSHAQNYFEKEKVYQKALLDQQVETQRVADDANEKIQQMQHILEMEKARRNSYEDTARKMKEENEILHQQYEALYGSSDSRNIIKLVARQNEMQKELDFKAAEIEKLNELLQNQRELTQKKLQEGLEQQKLDLKIKHDAEVNDLVKKQIEQQHIIVADKQETVYSVQQKVVQLEKENSDLIQLAREQQAKISYFGTEKRDQQDNFDKAIQKAKKRYEIVAGELETAVEQISDLKSRLQLAEDQKTAAKASFIEQRELQENFKEQNGRLETQIKGHLEAFGQLQAQLAVQGKQLQQMNTVRYDLQQLLLQKQELSGELDALQITVIDKEDCIKSKQAEVSRLETILTNKQDQIDQLRTRIEQLGAANDATIEQKAKEMAETYIREEMERISQVKVTDSSEMNPVPLSAPEKSSDHQATNKSGSAAPGEVQEAQTPTEENQQSVVKSSDTNLKDAQKPQPDALKNETHTTNDPSVPNALVITQQEEDFDEPTLNEPERPESVLQLQKDSASAEELVALNKESEAASNSDTPVAPAGGAYLFTEDKQRRDSGSEIPQAGNKAEEVPKDDSVKNNDDATNTQPEEPKKRPRVKARIPKMK